MEKKLPEDLSGVFYFVRGREFFEKAFGKNLGEFRELLYMPETLIIYRVRYEDNLTKDCRGKFLSLDADERLEAEQAIEQNKFSDGDISKIASVKVRGLLKFYQIRRK